MKKSQYIIFFLCVIIAIYGAWFFINRTADNGTAASIQFKDTEKIKLNEKVDAISLVKSTNSTKILYPKIDTSSPGKKSLLYIAINDKGEQKEFMKEIWVVDPTPPVLLLKKDKVEIYINEKFNPKSFIKEATSNYDGKLSVNINGDYKLDKVGTYKLNYFVKDSSDHKVTKTLTLVVKEKETKKEPQKKEGNPKQEIPKEPAQEQQPKDAPNNQETPASPRPNTNNANNGQTWMFSNGESFSSALKKCNSAGAASGRGYQCNVLQDENGIYTGYRLDLQ